MNDDFRTGFEKMASIGKHISRNAGKYVIGTGAAAGAAGGAIGATVGHKKGRRQGQGEMIGYFNQRNQMLNRIAANERAKKSTNNRQYNQSGPQDGSGPGVYADQK